MKRKLFIFVLVTTSLVLAACGPSGATPDASGQIIIVQEDDEGGMSFNPESIVLTAGETVTIVLENHGEKDHEFMIGKEVIYNESGAPDGFHEDFFHGWSDQVEVHPGMGTMLMIDGETVMMGGEMEMAEGDSMDGDSMGGMEEDGHEEEEMEHMGWMMMSPMGSSASSITFTVPADKVGEWEMACFEDDGTHYDDGMRGTLTIVEP